MLPDSQMRIRVSGESDETRPYIRSAWSGLRTRTISGVNSTLSTPISQPGLKNVHSPGRRTASALSCMTCAGSRQSSAAAVPHPVAAG